MSKVRSVYLGRQPIMDRANQVVAYELLFRASRQATGANVVFGLSATAEVITHAFTHMGAANVLGQHRGFINVDEELLLSEMLEFLPKDRVVLEILEGVSITPEVVERCAQLKAMGFQLALDDFTFNERYLPLFPLVEVVKLDLKLQNFTQLEQCVRKLRAWPVKLLAEKIDSPEDADRCREMGFDYFQGYYFAKPVTLAGRKASPAQIAMLRLLGMVLGDTEAEAIEQEIKRDPHLTINLLRLVNSVGSGLPRKISSLADALMILGRKQLQRWLQLLLFTRSQDGNGTQSPLFNLAATRGRLMELLVGGLWPNERALPDQGFVVGILSLADVLLGMSMAEVAGEINLPEASAAALVERKGNLGYLLRLAISLESNQPLETLRLLEQIPTLSLSRLTELQLQALAWVDSISQEH